MKNTKLTSSPHFRQSFSLSLSLLKMWINCSMPCLRTWSACCFVSDHDKGDPRERKPMATFFLNCKYNKLSDITLAIPAKINPVKGNHYRTSTSKLAFIFQLRNERTTERNSMNIYVSLNAKELFVYFYK